MFSLPYRFPNDIKTPLPTQDDITTPLSPPDDRHDRLTPIQTPRMTSRPPSHPRTKTTRSDHSNTDTHDTSFFRRYDITTTRTYNDTTSPIFATVFFLPIPTTSPDDTTGYSTTIDADDSTPLSYLPLPILPLPVSSSPALDLWCHSHAAIPTRFELS